MALLESLDAAKDAATRGCCGLMCYLGNVVLGGRVLLRW